MEVDILKKEKEEGGRVDFRDARAKVELGDDDGVEEELTVFVTLYVWPNGNLTNFAGLVRL